MARHTSRAEFVRTVRRPAMSFAIVVGLLVLAALAPGLGVVQAGPVPSGLHYARQIASPIPSPVPTDVGATMTPAPTTSTDAWRIADTGGIPARVRSSPSLSASVVMRLEPGTVVEPLSETASADGYQWRRISVSGASGWIVTTLLLEPPPPPRTPVYVVAAVGELGLNVRESPSTAATVIGSLQAGEVVELVAGPRESESRAWLQIRTESVTGWVIAEAISER